MGLRGHFRRRPRHEAVEAVLEPPEAAVLLQLCRELGTLIAAEAAGGAAGEAGGSSGGDPVLERLYPRAYLDPTEEHAESEWQRFVHDDLVAARRRSLDLVESTLAAAEEHRGRLRVDLSAEEAEAWLAVLNDARLTLGTRLEITEDLDPTSVDPADPLAGVYALYWWLGLMEEDLVAELMG